MIDAVIPYVDSSDRYWNNDFNKATQQYNTNTPRFRSWGTLRYLVRAISTNMPFIRRIILIVARESQVPIWVNEENIKVVYHRDFIPQQFLPTFNSCTIEAFLYRIDDISEQFVYFNDDMFPINKLDTTDFFEGNIPCIKFNVRHEYKKTMFRQQCRHSLDIMASTLNVPSYPAQDLLLPEHSLSSMLKSSINDVGQKCEKQLCDSITLLRNPRNINQYIYLYYQYFTGNYVDNNISYYYTELDTDMSSIKQIILGNDFHIVCINDSDKIKDYKKTREELLAIFEEKFPHKCKYEV